MGSGYGASYTPLYAQTLRALARPQLATPRGSYPTGALAFTYSATLTINLWMYAVADGAGTDCFTPGGDSRLFPETCQSPLLEAGSGRPGYLYPHQRWISDRKVLDRENSAASRRRKKKNPRRG